MKVVLQRVLSAQVDVSGETVGKIGSGLVVLAGIGHHDTQKSIHWMARKIAGLRIFSDPEGKMNLSVRDVGGSCLVISQFTLFGDCSKGFRPGFTDAAPPEEAREGFEAFVGALQDQEVPVETGVFQADMKVHLVNDGPVTLTLEKR
jgi:D-tyrosyl-tRNA(Tyr) deacylase